MGHLVGRSGKVSYELVEVSGEWRMNIVILGAHPDDPESGCGGLGILAVQQGHQVLFAYVSSGVPGNMVGSHPEDVVREEEARAACAVCGVDAFFFGCPNSDIPFDQTAVERVSDLLREVDADLVLTHWPVDTHPDHQAVGALGTQAVVGNPGVALAYYEVCAGIQAIAFEPNRVVDITEVASQKKTAVDCHVSQDIPSWWEYHDIMERRRYVQAFGVMSGAICRAEGYCLTVSTPQAEQLFSMRSGLRPSGARTARKSKHERIHLNPCIVPVDHETE